ncbi:MULTISPECIES: HAD family hydrolase [unclassified Nonomuraea]|uniref:HAD family hydrolase n=1 Tax=unclassified Nonomuraea TaxID=2593643 RepID=UPI0033C4EC2D
MRPLALFDLDNTLIDRLAAFRLWAAEFAAGRGLGPDAVNRLVRLDADGSVPMDLFFARVRERFALAEPVEELWRDYRARLPFLVECRAEVLAGLDRLRAAGWAVGIVTNGMADNQTGKIRRTGLAERVDGWAISGAEGVRKPDARLFEIAAGRCGAVPAGGWMVGDDPDKDVAGGRGAGMRTIWIDRGTGVARPQADVTVEDVLAAMEALTGMPGSGGGR